MFGDIFIFYNILFSNIKNNNNIFFLKTWVGTYIYSREEIGLLLSPDG